MGAGNDIVNTEKRATVSREAILGVSAHLFAQYGYRATNLQLVAEQLGVTRQALYYHFRNKGDILRALFEDVMRKMEDAVAAIPENSTEPQFTLMLKAHIGVIAANADLVALLLHERPEMAKLEPVAAAARRHAYNARFIRAYSDGVANGQLRPLDPATTVNILLASANATTSWYHGRSRAAEPDVRAHTEMLLTQSVHVNAAG
jgi:AcrR family transcriptional regulator